MFLEFPLSFDSEFAGLFGGALALQHCLPRVDLGLRSQGRGNVGEFRIVTLFRLYEVRRPPWEVFLAPWAR